MSDKKAALKKLITLLDEGLSPEEAKKHFKELIKDTSSDELAKTEELLVKEGMPREKLNKLCAVHLAVFREQLTQQKILTPLGHPITILLEEHRLILEFVEALKKLSSSIIVGSKKTFNADSKDWIAFKQLAQKFTESSTHYLREENALFPFIEKHGLTEPPAQMWIDHNTIRDIEKELFNQIQSAEQSQRDFSETANKIDDIVHQLATTLQNHFFKENNILFPSSLKLIAEGEWFIIRQDFDEIGYCAFTPENVLKNFSQKVEGGLLPKEVKQGVIEFETGPLPLEFIEPIFNSLPIDITFVDAKDIVRYYSKGDERIFVRTKSVIGRSVQNCHPQKSVHVVNQILDDFRAGKRKTAEFWIDFQGKKIHIRYFAVHNKAGKYLGCLEVSQDITDIQKLQGQKRLLD